MAGSDYAEDGLASQSRRYRMPGHLLNRHQVGGGVSRSPNGLFVGHGMEPTQGRPALRVKVTTRVPPPTSATHPRAPMSPTPHPRPSHGTQCAPSAHVHTPGSNRLQHQE